MKDGNVISILGVQTTISDSFREKYETEQVNLLKSVADISDQFDNCDFIIEKKIIGQEYMEQYYKTDGSDIWAQIERIIDSPSE